MKLSKRMLLWGESPGSRWTVTVYWPRYLWTREPVEIDGRIYPSDCATLSEQLREYKRREKMLKPPDDGNVEKNIAPKTYAPYFDHHSIHSTIVRGRV